MASSPENYVRSEMDAYVRHQVYAHLTDTFIQTQPLLFFLGLNAGENMQGLGTPDTATVFGTAGLSKAQLEMGKLAGIREFPYTLNEPSDSAYVGFGGATPTASTFAEDNIGTTSFSYTTFMDPLKIRKQSLEEAQSDTAIMAVVDNAMQPVRNAHVKNIAQRLWDGTLTATQQQKRYWDDGILGLTHTLTANNVYGRVDRSNETQLNPLVINAATDFDSTSVSMNIGRVINSGFTKTGGGKVTGLAMKSPMGRGVTVGITTPALWNSIADQADSKHQFTGDEIPNNPVSGFTNPVVRVDNVYFVYDDNCPDGVMNLLNPSTWMCEVHPKHNFDWTGFTDKSRTEEGGEMYEWGDLHTAIRLACIRPDCNARITGLTA